jgi:hypothetical protein
MTKRPSLLRRMAIALMEHAAWVLPSARGPWAKAMQHELPQIENDLDALAWAAGCLFAGYVERARAMTRHQKKIGLAAFLALAAIGAASWWAGQRPYLTPGNHQVFHDASTVGALAGFLVFVAAALNGLFALMLWINDRKVYDAARAARVGAVIFVPYLAALVLVSLLTPGTVVNIGDNYCYDLWCLGVDQVNANPRGQDILYTAEVRISVDSSQPHHLPVEQAKDFFYLLDDQGRRYPLVWETSFLNADLTVQPGESVKSSFAFLAPLKARKLYLGGDDDGGMHLPWVYLYFGGDVSLFHRPALLRIL